VRLELLALGVTAAVLAGAIAVRRAGLDVGLFLAVNAWRGIPDAVWHVLSVAGLGMTALLVVTLAPSRRPGVVAALPWLLVLGGGVVQLLKGLVDSPRPAAVLDPAQLHRVGDALRLGSMPSGHAMTAAAVLTILWLAGGPSWRRPRTLAAAGLLTAAIATSRVATGAHWPSDVAAGAALGFFAGCVSVRLARVTRTEAALARPIGRWALGAAQIACGAVIASLDVGYYGALPAQWALGALGFGAGLRTLAGRLAPSVAASARVEVPP
jgi:membrane-associated phospholipid phosphatase